MLKKIITTRSVFVEYYWLVIERKSFDFANSQRRFPVRNASGRSTDHRTPSGPDGQAQASSEEEAAGTEAAGGGGEEGRGADRLPFEKQQRQLRVSRGVHSERQQRLLAATAQIDRHRRRQPENHLGTQPEYQ